MEAPQSVNEVPAKKNRTVLIIVAAAVALGCFCLVAAVAGFYGLFAIRSVETQAFPEEEFPSVVTQEALTVPPTSDQDIPSATPGVDLSLGEAPTGGLGNDILRNDTWQYVGPAAVGLGCDQPVGTDSTIEVLEQPDGGVWKEKWTVACASGETYPFEVEYILDASGATFNIKSLP